jgi:predicted RNA-binding Zn-ribbon protein involved in translation (DUF1610 family)
MFVNMSINDINIDLEELEAVVGGYERVTGNFVSLRPYLNTGLAKVTIICPNCHNVLKVDKKSDSGQIASGHTKTFTCKNCGHQYAWLNDTGNNVWCI